jgi:putative FmdB family regulatory protein
MPMYEYRARDPEKASCYRCREGFDWIQSMMDAPLTACPECGQPVERLISLCSMSTAQSTRSMLSDKNLKAKGFTKLVNEGGGKFRKI